MFLKEASLALILVLVLGGHQQTSGFVLPSLLSRDPKVDVGCGACRAAVVSIQQLVTAGASEEAIEAAAIQICLNLDLYIEDVCRAMVKLEGPQIIYVLNTTQHDVDTICNVVLNTCDARLPDWSIPIPGGKPDLVPPQSGNSTYRILHLTDTHFDPEYTEGTPTTCDHPYCCRDWNDTITNDTAYAGRWGAEQGSCDAPLWTLEAALDAAVDLQPDIIYVTGDLSPHVVWLLDQDAILTSVVDTAAAIRRYFPDTPVAYTLGNHESSPVNSFAVPESYSDGYSMDWLYPLLETVWGDGGVPDSAMETILKGGYYHWSPVAGLRVIALNLNYGYHENVFMLVNHVDPTDQLVWLTQVLLDAEAAGEKAHIIGHIIFGSLLSSFSHSLNQIITRFESTVTGLFVGHSHKDEIQVNWDVENNERAVGITYSAPTISSEGVKSPSFRLYEVDGPDGSWIVRDSLTYSMNLTLANAGADPDFPLAYSAKEAYGLTDLLPTSWADLVFRMANDTELFDEYYRHYSNFWAEPADLPDCTAQCRGTHLCDMTTGDITDRGPCHRVQALVPGFGNVKRVLEDEPESYFPAFEMKHTAYYW